MVLTREVFKALGFNEFQAPLAEVQPSFATRIGGHKVTFVQVTNEYLAPVFFVSGIVSTSRTIGMIQLDMPIEVADFDQGIAWIAYALRGHFNENDKPQWLRDGERLKGELPWTRDEAKQAALWAARPVCTVERSWLRLAANDLRARVAEADKLDVAVFMFDGETLTIRADGKLLSMSAIGTAWPEPIQVAAVALAHLPMRLMSNPVVVDIWQGRLGIDNHRFNLVTPGGKKLPYATVAWTPPESMHGLGSILLKEQPQKALTRQAYRFALQSRLEHLIEAAGDDAPWLLKKVEENEPGLSLYGTPAQIAEILVENSNWLCSRARMPMQPVEAPLLVDRDALAHLQGDDDTLEAYLDALYYDGGGY
jgi:hypothetical protein